MDLRWLPSDVGLSAAHRLLQAIAAAVQDSPDGTHAVWYRGPQPDRYCFRLECDRGTGEIVAFKQPPHEPLCEAFVGPQYQCTTDTEARSLLYWRWQTAPAVEEDDRLLQRFGRIEPVRGHPCAPLSAEDHIVGPTDPIDALPVPVGCLTIVCEGAEARIAALAHALMHTGPGASVRKIVLRGGGRDVAHAFLDACRPGDALGATRLVCLVCLEVHVPNVRLVDIHAFLERTAARLLSLNLAAPVDVTGLAAAADPKGVLRHLHQIVLHQSNTTLIPWLDPVSYGTLAVVWEAGPLEWSWLWFVERERVVAVFVGPRVVLDDDASLAVPPPLVGRVFSLNVDLGWIPPPTDGTTPDVRAHALLDAIAVAAGDTPTEGGDSVTFNFADGGRRWELFRDRADPAGSVVSMERRRWDPIHPAFIGPQCAVVDTEEDRIRLRRYWQTGSPWDTDDGRLVLRFGRLEPSVAEPPDVVPAPGLVRRA